MCRGFFIQVSFIATVFLPGVLFYRQLPWNLEGICIDVEKSEFTLKFHVVQRPCCDRCFLPGTSLCRQLQLNPDRVYVDVETWRYQC